MLDWITSQGWTVCVTAKGPIVCVKIHATGTFVNLQEAYKSLGGP